MSAAGIAWIAMRILLNLLGALGLSAACVGLVFGMIFIVETGVLPAIASGSLDVNMDFHILNHTWHGNQIYILLATYLILVLGMARGVVLLVKRARQIYKQPGHHPGRGKGAS